jgi:hypothetical protein
VTGVEITSALTVYSKEPEVLMVPANTLSPVSLSTGRLSPVMGAWLTLALPLTTRPSSAMRSPGLTRATTATDCAAISLQRAGFDLLGQREQNHHRARHSRRLCRGHGCGRRGCRGRARS